MFHVMPLFIRNKFIVPPTFFFFNIICLKGMNKCGCYFKICIIPDYQPILAVIYHA